MTVLVTGAGGQLGRALVRAGGDGVIGLDRAALDVTEAAAVAAQLDRLTPAVVINAAAYTAVDAAEHHRDRAFAANALGPAHLARACAARGIGLVHVSTELVFDGRAGRPYREDDAVAPLGVYGLSKAAGERAVLEAGGTVVRTSWLFGGGGRGFVPAIVAAAGAAARTGQPLRVIADRHGCPTFAGDLAEVLLELARRPPVPGLLHWCGDEATTWYGFAVALVAALGLDVDVTPIPATAWPEVAPRPASAVLDTARARALGLPPRRWRDRLSSSGDSRCGTSTPPPPGTPAGTRA